MDKLTTLSTIFEQARLAGLAKTQKDFAALMDINRTALSAALNGNESYLTDSLVSKAIRWRDEYLGSDASAPKQATLPVIPTEAMAGTLGEFAESCKAYECERMVSPIKGADYAIKVCGDSMSPEIPNGSQILIKKIYEDQFIEWGKIYCLDTLNGAVIKRLKFVRGRC